MHASGRRTPWPRCEIQHSSAAARRSKRDSAPTASAAVGASRAARRAGPPLRASRTSLATVGQYLQYEALCSLPAPTARPRSVCCTGVDRGTARRATEEADGALLARSIAPPPTTPPTWRRSRPPSRKRPPSTRRRPPCALSSASASRRTPLRARGGPPTRRTMSARGATARRTSSSRRRPPAIGCVGGGPSNVRAHRALRPARVELVAAPR